MATIPLRSAALAESLLWTETDDNGEPLDRDYSATDVDAADLAKLTGQFDSFCEAAHALLWQAIEAGTLPDWFDPAEHSLSDLGPNNEHQLEHDYILTRNGHGAGFWDGDWQALGDELTRLAHSAGGVDAYVGGDGKVYLYGL